MRAAGRFTADGAGNVTNGELDANSATESGVQAGTKFTGTYSIGADQRGVLALNAPPFRSFDTRIRDDDERQRPGDRDRCCAGNSRTSVGDYRKGRHGGLPHGLDCRGLCVWIRGPRRIEQPHGLWAASRRTEQAVLSQGAADINEHGAIREYTGAQPVIFASANYDISDTSSGRGALSVAGTAAGSLRTFHFVFYAVNAGKLLAMETDAIKDRTALLSGLVLRQQPTPEGFSDASWNGSLVAYLTARTTCGSGSRVLAVLAGLFTAACGSGATPVPVVLAGLLTADGQGGVTLTFDQNCGGLHRSAAGLSGTYKMGRNGRASINVGSYAAVAYLVTPQQAFLLGTDSSGFLEGQSTGMFNNNIVRGSYAGLTVTPASPDVLIMSGKFSADGAGPMGKLAGSSDIANGHDPLTGQTITATYSISSSPVNGRGTMTFRYGALGSAVLYVVSPKEFVAIPLNDPNPAVRIFQQ